MRSYRGNGKSVVVRILFFLLLSLSVLQRVWYAYIIDASWCILDVFVYMTDVFYYTITLLPISILDYFYLSQKMRLPIYIIKMDTRKNLFQNQMRLGIKVAFLYSALFTILIIVWSVHHGLTFFNWGEVESRYCKSNDALFVGNGISVLAMGFFLLFVRTSVLLLLFEIIKWHTNRAILGFLACIIISGLEIASNVFFSFGLIHKKIYMDYAFWVNIYRRLWILFFIIGFCVFIELYISLFVRKKDFIHE